VRSAKFTHERARALRKALSPPEILLWTRLRERGRDQPTFRRQHPIGAYIADFYCAAARLVVEIDGWGHADEGRPEHDRRRDDHMSRLGRQVIRIAAAEVMRDADAVAQMIVDTAISRSPNAPSAGAPSVRPSVGHLPRFAGEELTGSGSD
jgi:very-short-patch-repair endonuclease